MSKAIFKWNGGAGALLCSRCSVIMRTYKDFSEDEKLGFTGEKRIPAKYCDDCTAKMDKDAEDITI